MAFDHTAFVTLLQYACGAIRQFEYNQNAATYGFLARYASFQSNVTGYDAKKVLDGFEKMRKALGTVGAMARTVLEPLVLQYMNEVVGKPYAQVNQACWDDFVQHFVDNSYTVNRRNFSRGSAAADVSNQWSGTGYRLTTDDRGNAIESSDPGVVEAKCINMVGQSGVQRYQSQWTVRHRNPADDVLDRYNSPITPAASATEMWPDEEYVINPSFDTGVAGTLAAAPSGWEFDTGTASNNALDGTNYFRKDNGKTPLALRANETIVLSQYLATTKKSFNWYKPVFAALAFNNEVGSFVGTLSFDICGQNTSVAISAQTGWNWLVKARDENCWMRQFKEDNPAISINVTRTSGYLLLDTFIVRSFDMFDNTGIALLGGDSTVDDAHKEDEITWTDTIASEGVVQRCFHLAFRRHLPPSGSPTITDPSIGAYA